MVIYADVLVALNLYINYFLLYGTALILKRGISRKKCVIAALIGAFGALIIFVPTLNFLLSAAYKIALGALMTFVAFGKQKPADFAVCALVFLVVNFIFAGIMNALWVFFSPIGMIYENGICYFNIPITAIIAFTAAGFFLIKLMKMILGKFSRKDNFCEVKISANNAEITLKGLCDTGCEVVDLFTKIPVIICDYAKISRIIPQEIEDYFAGILGDKIRLIPCSTVAKETLIPIFKADKIMINGKSAEAFVGISKAKLGEDFDCILNPKIISI